MAEICIIDQGIGMTEKEVRSAFKPFYCGASQKHMNPNGIGIGLTISKLICENLEGEIAVKS